MIELSYQGVDNYNVYIGAKMVQLTTMELEHICEAVLADESNFEIPKRDKLLESNEECEDELNEPRDKISYHIGKIEELMDDEETEPIHLIRELEKMKKIIEESE